MHGGKFFRSTAGMCRHLSERNGIEAPPAPGEEEEGALLWGWRLAWLTHAALCLAAAPEGLPGLRGCRRAGLRRGRKLLMFAYQRIPFTR